MKKYLLISILTTLPLTQAFATTPEKKQVSAAENHTTIEAKFTSPGKIVLEPALQEINGGEKKIEITSGGNSTAAAGNYNITIYNGDMNKPCYENTDMLLEAGKTYEIASDASVCGVRAEDSTTLSH
jgi:hypothetical protein